MIELDSGNVLLKPSQRKQLMAWLRRVLRLGQRVGDFALKITLHRNGKQIEAKAAVHDAVGDFGCRSKQTDLRNAMRELARKLVAQLQVQRVQAQSA